MAVAERTPEHCYRCNEPALAGLGTIYVRRQIDGQRVNAPICPPCFAVTHPGRLPHWVRPPGDPAVG